MFNYFSYACFFKFIHINSVQLLYAVVSRCSRYSLSANEVLPSLFKKKKFLSLLFLGVSSGLQLRDSPPPPPCVHPEPKWNRAPGAVQHACQEFLLQVYPALQMKINTREECFWSSLCSQGPVFPQPTHPTEC